MYRGSVLHLFSKVSLSFYLPFRLSTCLHVKNHVNVEMGASHAPFIVSYRMYQVVSIYFKYSGLLVPSPLKINGQNRAFRAALSRLYAALLQVEFHFLQAQAHTPFDRPQRNVVALGNFRVRIALEIGQFDDHTLFGG